MKNLFALLLVLFAAVLPASAAPILLDNFSGSVRLNGDGDTLWRAYNTEDPGQNSNQLGGQFNLVVPSVPSGIGAYMIFSSRDGGYRWSTGGVNHDTYMHRRILDGTWSTAVNRLSFLVKVNVSRARRADGGDNVQIGTYIRDTSTVDNATQGVHYYHLLNTNFVPNVWMKVILNEKPQHRRSFSGGYEHNLNPEDTGSTPTDYWTGNTIWYWDTQGSGFEGSTWAFDDFYFNTSAYTEPDSMVASITAMYTGTRYELTWASNKNVSTTYEVRYKTTSMHASTFASGTDGGTVSSPGNAYVGTIWTSSLMAESVTGMYFGIRKVGTTDFTEVYIPYQMAPGNSGEDTTSAPANSIPVVTSNPSNQSVTAPATAVFTCAASGVPSPSYQWQVNGVNVTTGTGGTSASYTTAATTTAINGTAYRCIASNSEGADTSTAATLSVAASPGSSSAGPSGSPKVTQIPGDLRVSNRTYMPFLTASRLAILDSLGRVESNPALTPNGFLYPSAAGRVASTAAAGNGQLLIGSAGVAPVLGNLAGTTNQISISSGPGTLAVGIPNSFTLPSASPAFTAVTVAADPTLPLQLATKQYVDASGGGGGVVGDSTGTGPVVRQTSATLINPSWTGTLTSPYSASRILVTNSSSQVVTHTGALTTNGFLYGGGPAAFGVTAAPTNGQILIGRTGLAPVAGAVAGTANQITVTLGAGTITASLPSDLVAPGTLTVTGRGRFLDSLQAANLAGSGVRMVVVDDSGEFATQTIPAGSSLANPSGLIGLTAVNGVATSGTRSDGRHALDQSIAPTWTGAHSFTAGFMAHSGSNSGGVALGGGSSTNNAADGGWIKAYGATVSNLAGYVEIRASTLSGLVDTGIVKVWPAAGGSTYFGRQETAGEHRWSMQAEGDVKVDDSLAVGGGLSSGSGRSVKTNSLFSSTTLDHTYDHVVLNPGSLITITLPAAAAHPGRRYVLINIAQTQGLIVERTGSETINGVAGSVSLERMDGSAGGCSGGEFWSDGTGWYANLTNCATGS
jgi:hypothetical protein